MKQGPLAALVILIALLIGPAAAQAAAPANDYFGAAAPLSVGQEISGTNLEATYEPGEPDHAEVSKSASCQALTDGPHCATSVWFTFEAPTMGTYTIETCDMGTDFDTVLGLYTGATVATAEKVISNDDGEECPAAGTKFGSRLIFKTGAGIPYHVALTGFAGSEGSFYIRAYEGEGAPRPKPDTGVIRFASFLNAKNGGLTFGVTSGPRHSPGFPVESDVPGATFECSLDDAPYAACDPPVSYAGIAPGSAHVFKARASAGGATDPTPVIERFTIDPTPPETTIVSGPSGSTSSQEAVWTATPSERNNLGALSCRIDGQVFSACGSFTTTFKELCQGPHDYAAAGVDPAGNVDPSPAGAHIDVTSGPACAAPTLGPPGPPALSPTSAVIDIPFDDKGAGATLRVEYGPTSGYGMRTDDVGLGPLAPTSTKILLRFLTPNTEYHYRVTITTPFGTADTGDQTLTTKPLEGTLPIVANTGAPRVGYFTASLPFSIDPQGSDTSSSAFVDTAKPVTLASPFVFASLSAVVPGTAVGPQPRAFQLADLEPNTTYNYRLAATQFGMTSTNEALGPEGSFTTAALPPVPVAATKPHFKLRKRMVRVGKLTRRSKEVAIEVRELPATTVTVVKLIAGKRHLKARKKAKANGKVKFKIHFPKKFRKALRDKRLKKVKIKVSASPPGDTTSRVTLKKRLRG